MGTRTPSKRQRIRCTVSGKGWAWFVAAVCDCYRQLRPRPHHRSSWLHSVDGAQCGSGRNVMLWAAIVSETTNGAVSEQPETRKGLPMSKVKYISSSNEIPVGQEYVLVMYGEEYAQTRHPLGLTITVARTVSQLSFLTAVHTAKEIAKHAGMKFLSAPPEYEGLTPPPAECSPTFPHMTN